MFKDQLYSAEGFDSSWKDKKESCNESCQTTEFFTKEQGTSTAKSAHVRTQTDNKKNDVSTSVDMNKLATWLNSVCPDMMNQLKDESVSNAMSSLSLNDNQLSVSASLLQEINIIPDKKGDFYVSSLSWNSTGNTLGVSCSYGHETWCHHEGIVYLYRFTRDDNLPSTPYKQLKCTACVTSLSFHPTLPSVLAAATITGEVLLWNNQNDENDSLIASIAEHDDRITQIAWISNLDSKKPSIVLASAGLDSYLILWTVNIEDSFMDVKQKFTTGKVNKSISSPEVFSKKSDGGIIQFDFSPHISGLFVLGMEGGTVIKCTILGAKSLSNNEGPGGSILDPTVSYYERHEGDITSIKFSPHRKELFLTCGTDNEIRIFHVDQATPVQIIFMDIILNDVCWILHEEKLLVGCSDKGSVRLYSLLNGQLIPNIFENNKDSLFKIALNTKRINMAAFGNCKGQVQLWSIPWNNIASQDKYNVYGKSG